MKVLVTTKHRGVFFGDMEDDSTAPEKLVLTGARNCLYWDSTRHGFLGLAEKGPSDKCRVGPSVEELTLYDITCIAKCTEEAAKRWESVEWNG